MTDLVERAFALLQVTRDYIGAANRLIDLAEHLEDLHARGRSESFQECAELAQDALAHLDKVMARVRSAAATTEEEAR